MFQGFIIITLEGWTEIMYYARKANDTRFFDIYFYIVMYFGAFFVINYLIAIEAEQFQHYLTIFQSKERERKKLELEA